MPLQLEISKRREFVEALMKAFRTNELLSAEIFLQTGVKLNDFINLNDGRRVVFPAAAQIAEDEGWLEQFIQAVIRKEPPNPWLIDFANTVGVTVLRREDLPQTVQDPRRRGLQEVIRVRRPPMLMQVYSERLAITSRATCWIGRTDTAGSDRQFGTGFLVGPDLVLTNHHVIRKILDGEFAPADLVLRFDHLTSTQAKGSPRSEAHLGEPWCIDKAPHAPSDEFTDGRPPRPDELDYALLRIDREAGREDGGGQPRGWLATSANPPPLQTDDFVVIVQHPAGGENSGLQQVALGLMLKFNEGFTRIEHDASTKPGSSGSPCLTMDLQLAGLHHGTAPVEDTRGTLIYDEPCYNRSIPLRPIIAQMKSRNISPFWTTL